MNIGIFTSTAQPVLLHYIRTWSELPAESLALDPADPGHLPPGIRNYIDNAAGEVGINVPLTASRQYLREVERAEARLLRSIGQDPDLSVPSFAAFWAGENRIDTVMQDLAKLRQLHNEALGLLRVWQSLTVQLCSARDIHSTLEQPDELRPCLAGLQQYLLSRIGLARKSIGIAFQQIGTDATRMITQQSLAKAIGAFFDEGQRAEFEATPLAVSLQTYLSA